MLRKGELCAEGLTCMLKDAEERRALTGIKIIRDSPSVGQTKKEVFRFIQAKVEGRIKGWKGKLSQAGKEVMIKSVTSAIPNFIMNCFKLPSGIIDDLNSTMAHFLWANGEGEKGIHWKTWDKLCEDEGRGGLGFKDLECMNLALLAKQGWRVATQEASLLFKLLKGRYFRRSSFLHAKLGANPSYGWRNLLKGRKVLAKGVRWRVEHLLGSDDATSVLSIPLSRRNGMDKLIWNYTRSGVYLTCLGYKCARDMIRNGECRGKTSEECSSGSVVDPCWSSL
ncbi:hypothetical protein LIER_12842 [Lithospermum erythrorhizon]|uniref:Reverse transcriptase n=1 Tax=Lithospermum erythrorhizon TaxID=34254 RepID=A0AAV3PXE1_LITER